LHNSRDPKIDDTVLALLWNLVRNTTWSFSTRVAMWITEVEGLKNINLYGHTDTAYLAFLLRYNGQKF